MKKWVCGLLLLVACNAFAAVNHYRVDVEITAVPVDGDTLVVNGVTTTFKTAVTGASTQILIGADEEETAENLVAHFDEYPLSGVTLVQDPSAPTKISFVASTVGVVMTGSETGSWGTVTVTVTSITGYTVQLPLVILPDAQHRTNVANDLIVALMDYSTTNFNAGKRVLTNYVDLTTAKTISGANLFTGATILSNAYQLFKGGGASNLWLQMVDLGGTTNNIRINGTVLIGADANGKLGMWESGDGVTRGAAASVAIEDHTIPNGLMGDVRWGRKSGVNTWSGDSNIFTLLLRAENFQGIITNSTGAFTNLYATNFYGYGPVLITNDVPRLYFHDTDAPADEKDWRIAILDGELSLAAWTEDGLTGEEAMIIRRDGESIVDVIFSYGVTAIGNLRVSTSHRVESTGHFAGVVGIGTTNVSIPTSLDKGLVFTNGTPPSASPVNGFAMWSVGGEPGYRNASGDNKLLHNDAGISIGSGSDYNLTGSYAQITFGGSVSAALPSAGTYLVRANVSVQADASNANDVISAKLYNSTDAADVTGSERTISSVPAAKRAFVTLENIVTVAAAKTIQLYGVNSTAARGSVDSEQTSLSWVRLY